MGFLNTGQNPRKGGFVTGEAFVEARADDLDEAGMAVPPGDSARLNSFKNLYNTDLTIDPQREGNQLAAPQYFSTHQLSGYLTTSSQ